uniref:hypothetical protein n=1 Tax=Acetatifactor sp. TaxID=1872090 RepID=UPI004055C606
MILLLVKLLGVYLTNYQIAPIMYAEISVVLTSWTKGIYKKYRCSITPLFDGADNERTSCAEGAVCEIGIGCVVGCANVRDLLQYDT